MNTQNAQNMQRRRATSAARAMNGAVALGVVCALGCNTTEVLPPGTRDPSTYNTPSGAMQVAQGAVGLFRVGVEIALDAGGRLTDELDDLAATKSAEPINQRSSEITETGYEQLQTARGQAMIARAALAKYGPNLPPALRAEMYALEGYADIYLADLYCSGVPLSTVNFEQDQSFTYAPGSTTAGVYYAAAALLDTAIALSHDSLRIETLARVGLGRALLAIGQRDSAARVVAAVPDTATYSLRMRLAPFLGRLNGVVSAAVSEREGDNGLPFVSANDPRVPITIISAVSIYGAYTFPMFAPYASSFTGDSVTVVLANGVEARLTEAEAQLTHGGTTWLRTLNRLRTDSTYTTSVRRDPVTSDSIGVDTAWNAGAGGIAGLPPLADPGSDSARVSLLFKERGFWLYLSGHRQGDLRRLVRATGAGGYGRPQSRVYPVGLSEAGLPYGSAVVLPIPTSEELRNPLSKGCLNHDA